MDDRQPTPVTSDAARREPSSGEPNGRRWIVSIFGDSAVGEPPRPGVTPLIRVRGVTLFGSLKVWSP
jgi:hypothetical protein